VRVRLTLWYVAVMVVVLAVYAVGVYTFVSRSVSQALDDRLRADFYWAAATVDVGPDGVVMPLPKVDLLLEEEAPWVQVWSDDGQLLFLNAEAMRRPLPESQKLAARAEDSIVSFQTAGAPVRVMSGHSYVCPCVEDPQTLTLIGKRRVTVQVARSEGAMQQQLRDLLLILVLGLPLAVGVAGLGGYVLARRTLAPIEEMTDRAKTITAERLGDRLPVANPENEMGRLATVFNETLGRLEASFDQMRRFTTDVSHELRTPLTAIRSVGEVGLRGGHRDESTYRSIIGSMLEEVDRLASLVDRLLTLSRAETGQAELSRDTVDLSALADDVVSHLAVLAEEKRQTLSIDRQASPVVSADRLVLRQALINLVDNAIKFTPASGRVRIRIAETPRDAVIEVIDSGPGISHEARDRIFDRFYRANDASGNGSGLGLSLAKGAVEALGGHLTLAETGANGTAFRIAIPRECQ
jgi:heavy metal sensor kinase